MTIITVGDVRRAIERFSDNEQIIVDAYVEHNSVELIIERIGYKPEPNVQGNVVIYVSD